MEMDFVLYGFGFCIVRNVSGLTKPRRGGRTQAGVERSATPAQNDKKQHNPEGTTDIDLFSVAPSGLDI